MKKVILLACLAMLANCSGSELGDCDQPARLTLAVSANPMTLNEEILVVSHGVDNFCRSVPEGTLIQFYVNGYGYYFTKNGKDQIDAYATELGASVELVATQILGQRASLNAVMVIDGEIIEATPIELTVTR